MSEILLSLCIPCCGRLNYVRKTLLSIYKTTAPLEKFEVILSDNDPNGEIGQLLQEFKYHNLIYHRTQCEGFMNSYYALKYGSGRMLKLHNSQSLFRDGSIERMLNQINEHREEDALVFYTNGLLGKFDTVIYDTYDSFMYNLSYWSSWSNGFSIWKADLDKLVNIELNSLFPQTSMLITQFLKDKYIINDEIIFDIQLIPKRGGHNKFKAFTIDYPSIIYDGCEAGIISERSKQRIFSDILREFLPSLIFNKYIARIETFDATHFTQYLKRYFSSNALFIVLFNVPIVPFRIIYRRLLNKIHSKKRLNNVVNWIFTL